MINKLLNRFSYLDALIRKRATGSPRELAQKLGLSERAWYKLRDELVNDLGVPLTYCSTRKTYYYAQEGELVFQFRRLGNKDMQKLDGGCRNPQPGRAGFRLPFLIPLHWEYSGRFYVDDR